MLKNLADIYVDEPAVEFPVGKLIIGRILEYETGRMQLSLKPSDIVTSSERIYW